MAEVKEHTQLIDIVRREVDLYAGETHDARMVSFSDPEKNLYGVIIIPDDANERPAYLAVLALIHHDYVIIEEDGTVDKPLHEALMVNGGIPRDKIVLAYKGETR